MYLRIICFVSKGYGDYRHSKLALIIWIVVIYFFSFPKIDFKIISRNRYWTILIVIMRNSCAEKSARLELYKSGSPVAADRSLL